MITTTTMTHHDSLVASFAGGYDGPFFGFHEVCLKYVLPYLDVSCVVHSL